MGDLHKSPLYFSAIYPCYENYVQFVYLYRASMINMDISPLLDDCGLCMKLSRYKTPSDDIWSQSDGPRSPLCLPTDCLPSHSRSPGTSKGHLPWGHYVSTCSQCLHFG